MRISRALITAIFLLSAAALSAVPAFAWLWPIFGFGPGPCPPPSYDIAPSPILPGGYEWVNIPSGPAHLVEPGYTYGLSAFTNGRLCFNRIPIFGVPTAAAPSNISLGNKTIGNTTTASKLF